MPLNLPTFFKRLGSSVVFVAVMLTGLLWNEWSFPALMCLINFLCIREFIRLVQLIDKDAYWPKWMPAIVQLAGFTWLLLVFLDTNTKELQVTFSVQRMMYVFVLTFAPLFMLFSVFNRQAAWQACSQSFFGLFYIAVSLSLLPVLRNYHHLLPLFIIILIWVNDTGAYLVGSFIGKTPFSPISPKKTWEGFIGATIFTIAGSMLIGHYYLQAHPGSLNVPYDWISFAITGLVVSVAGPAGDLFKSKFKRIAGVKDSGNLMPGHGGALDRFDSLLMVTPFVFCLVYCFI